MIFCNYKYIAFVKVAVYKRFLFICLLLVHSLRKLHFCHHLSSCLMVCTWGFNKDFPWSPFHFIRNAVNLWQQYMNASLCWRSEPSTCAQKVWVQNADHCIIFTMEFLTDQWGCCRRSYRVMGWCSRAGSLERGQGDELDLLILILWNMYISNFTDYTKHHQVYSSVRSNINYKDFFFTLMILVCPSASGKQWSLERAFVCILFIVDIQ